MNQPWEAEYATVNVDGVPQDNWSFSLHKLSVSGSLFRCHNPACMCEVCPWILVPARTLDPSPDQ